jgi:Trypsin-co-occurring domain 1
MGLASMPSEVVRYRVDAETIAQFEIEPVSGFRPAGAGDIAGTIRQSVGPAVEAARVLLEEIKDIAPHGVQVKFGIKVTGTANWLVAKAATEANFEVTLSWQPGGMSAVAGGGD